MKICNIDKYRQMICVTVFYHLHKSPFNTIFYCSHIAHITKGICMYKQIMRDKSSGIMVMSENEKKFRVFMQNSRTSVRRKIISGTVMDRSQELQTRTRLFDTHANECYYYICEQFYISPSITPRNSIVYIRVVQSYKLPSSSCIICSYISGIFHLSCGRNELRRIL